MLSRTSTAAITARSFVTKTAILPSCGAALQKTLRGYASSSSEECKRTALYDFHLQNGAKMVPFAGWEMPVSYSNLSHIKSHMFTRENASLFDVSHMLQTKWTGKDRIKFMELLTVGDIAALPVGSSTLSVFTNPNGGIIDDTVIQKWEDSLYIVSNAGCADKDLAHFREQMKAFKAKGGDVDFKIMDDLSLVALQGPKSAPLLEKLVGEDLSSFAFMAGRPMNIKGIQCHVTRCGYTGEDGFELSVPSSKVSELAEVLLKSPDVELAGLGARDSLRLEAGLCLYGHDMDESITPVEAGLTWTIGQRRRAEGGFLGADKVLPQIKGGVSKRRVGFIVDGAPAREHAELYNANEEKIGDVTSGCPSPCLKKNIGMGYVAKGNAKAGTEIFVKVRNKMQKATVTKMPFVPHRYHRA